MPDGGFVIEGLVYHLVGMNQNSRWAFIYQQGNRNSNNNNI